jgi:hypothetical protein
MTDSRLARQMDVVQGMLHKSVIALAIVPTNRSLTVTGRKAYSVMLGLAQLQAARGGEGPAGGFSAPLNSILRGFGANNSISVDTKRYIDQMISTKVEWRPLSKSEQQFHLSAETKAVPELPVEEPAITEEHRVFNLLAEVRIYKRAGENWVTWYYPPSIREELVSPTRWAQIDFDVLKELTTYCSVTLYEICARYRDSPAGLTSRQHWTWWTETLRSSPHSKVRAWRKFKNEFLAAAIKEINAQGDIEIELIEFRRGREVEQVQFSVKRSNQRPPRLMPTPADITNILHASDLGVRESVIEDLEREFGASAVSDGLNRLERFVKRAAPAGARKESEPFGKVQNTGAYLRRIVANQKRERAADESRPAGASASESQLVDPREPVRQVPQSRDALADEERHRRYVLVRSAFEQLPTDEQFEWVRKVQADAETNSTVTTGIMRRLTRGEWQSPLVQVMVINFYARSEFGAQWTTLPLDAFRVSDRERIVDIE